MAIETIQKGKKYKIVITISNINGNKKRHCETVYGGKREAESREREIKRQLEKKTFVKRNQITVSDFFDDWLEYSKERWSPKTYYANICWVKNIKKVIGNIYLQQLDVKTLENFYKYLRTKTNLSKTTIRHHYTIITTALNKAVLWGYIATNPNNKIEKPKGSKKEINCYCPSEALHLLEVIKGEPLKYQALIQLAIDSGARRSEITGLTWDDIDFDTGYITINKCTQYTKLEGIYEKEPKSATSNRTFKLCDSTIKILRKYRKEQLENKLRLGTKWKNSKRVFTTLEGADMHPDTPSKILEKIIRKYNLKRITFHGLRHTAISLQIANGIQPQIISRRAGHSNISITHSIYSHFFNEEFDSVADTINNFLNA